MPVTLAFETYAKSTTSGDVNFGPLLPPALGNLWTITIMSAGNVPTDYTLRDPSWTLVGSSKNGSASICVWAKEITQADVNAINPNPPPYSFYDFALGPVVPWSATLQEWSSGSPMSASGVSAAFSQGGNATPALTAEAGDGGIVAFSVYDPTGSLFPQSPSISPSSSNGRGGFNADGYSDNADYLSNNVFAFGTPTTQVPYGQGTLDAFYLPFASASVVWRADPGAGAQYVTASVVVRAVAPTQAPSLSVVPISHINNFAYTSVDPTQNYHTNAFTVNLNRNDNAAILPVGTAVFVWIAKPTNTSGAISTSVPMTRLFSRNASGTNGGYLTCFYRIIDGTEPLVGGVPSIIFTFADGPQFFDASFLAVLTNIASPTWTILHQESYVTSGVASTQLPLVDGVQVGDALLGAFAFWDTTNSESQFQPAFYSTASTTSTDWTDNGPNQSPDNMVFSAGYKTANAVASDAPMAAPFAYVSNPGSPNAWNLSTVVVRAAASSGSPAPVTLTSVDVVPANASGAIGAYKKFKAFANYSDGSRKDISGAVTWSADHGTVIDANGMAAISYLGIADITATPT